MFVNPCANPAHSQIKTVRLVIVHACVQSVVESSEMKNNNNNIEGFCLNRISFTETRTSKYSSWHIYTYFIRNNMNFTYP